MKLIFLKVIGIIFLILVLWGLIGSSQASQVGNTCDFGIKNDGGVFCWKWHQNVIGDIQEGFNTFINK